jgi:hypothetical protein
MLIDEPCFVYERPCLLHDHDSSFLLYCVNSSNTELPNVLSSASKTSACFMFPDLMMHLPLIIKIFLPSPEIHLLSVRSCNVNYVAFRYTFHLKHFTGNFPMTSNFLFMKFSIIFVTNFPIKIKTLPVKGIIRLE